MNGATAGSGWWDDATGGDDAPEREATEPPVDNRTTQQVPRIDPPDAEAEAGVDAETGSQVTPPPPSPWTSRSADTVRIDAPAWFLRAQKLAAEQARVAEPDPAAGPAGEDPVGREHARAGDDEAATDASPIAAIDPNAVERKDDVDPPPAVPGPPPAVGTAPGRARFLDPTIAASYREPRPTPDLIAGAIGLLGAAMLSIGSFMTWARSEGAVEVTVTGLGGSNGAGTLACGAVVGFGAVLVLTGRRGGLVGGAMLIAALAAVYFCGFSAVDILRTGDELPEILVGAGIDRGAAEVATLGLTSGFAVVAAGAAAALAAGTIAFARRV